MVCAVPSSAQLTVGGGGAVSITPFTCPTFSVVSVYVHGHTTPTIGRVVSWNPVISVEAPVVAIPPLLITVWIPWLVIPAPPPSAPNSEIVGPRTTGGVTTPVPVVKVQGFGGGPMFTSRGLPFRSLAPVVTVTV